ncbi:hypothetical protein [Streptomyces jumonjinensis]|uniref:Uncharacterized protein n=1 Tax=Streptomyces jumonjinensis TaxID=1945 RepID=A0A646KLF5_STRJU|nr:hypothetical protein [Streptomyces jumonjinensis]MQT03149.1 hypothetical protein [Streptomyces jumonjinensis]
MDRISVTASRRLVAAGHRHGTGPLAVMSAADLAAHAAASHVRPTVTVIPGDFRLTRHAITAWTRTSPGRQQLIIDLAEQYLAQIDRPAIPGLHDTSASSTTRNRIYAYDLHDGQTITHHLGLSGIHPATGQLATICRALVAHTHETADLPQIPSADDIAAAEHDARAELVTAYITATARHDQVTAAHIRYEATLWDLTNNGPSLIAELDGTRETAAA